MSGQQVDFNALSSASSLADTDLVAIQSSPYGAGSTKKATSVVVKQNAYAGVSGAVTINSSGVAALGTDAVTTTTIEDLAVTIPKVEEAIISGQRDIEISFEENEQFNQTIPFEGAVTITSFRSEVIKAIADTDNATIIPSGTLGVMGNGTVTIAASSALGDIDTSTPNSNQGVTAGGNLTLGCAKTTPGGRVRLTIFYILVPS